VRLSALYASAEVPTRGFSEQKVFNYIRIFQPVTGASIAEFASLCMTMRSYSMQISRTI